MSESTPLPRTMSLKESRVEGQEIPTSQIRIEITESRKMIAEVTAFVRENLVYVTSVQVKKRSEGIGAVIMGKLEEYISKSQKFGVLQDMTHYLNVTDVSLEANPYEGWYMRRRWREVPDRPSYLYFSPHKSNWSEEQDETLDSLIDDLD